MRPLACVFLLFIPQYLFATCNIHIQNPSGQSTIAFPTNDFDTCADLAKVVNTENINQEVPERAPWIWSHYTTQITNISAQMYLFSTQRNSTFGSGGFSITEEPIEECSERDDILFPHAIASISPAHCFSQCEYLSRSSSEPGSEKALVYEPTGEACVDGDSSGSGGDSGGSDCGGGGAYAGNPIKVGPSNKIQQETDFDFSYKTSMPFTRTYNSNLPARGFFGFNWTSVLDQQVVFDINKTEAYIRRADGWTQFFTQQNGIWVAENGSGDDLKEHLDGTWSFLDSSGQTTVFNRTGRIIRITQPTGDSLYISWNGGRWPTGVSNDTKKLLDITVNTVTNLVEVIIDSTGLRVTYGYENERLESVNFSFAGSSLGTVNYDYDDPNLHYLLTGLRDEENDAYATWEYNSKAEAIYSGHGVVDSEGKRKEEVSLLRHGDGTTTVTNPFGKETVYRTERYLGASKVTHVEGVSTSNCLPSNAYLSYDDIGNRDFVTDAKGNVTDYDYNTLGQMTRKIEGLVWEGESRTNAVATPNTRTTEWVWDPENHLIDMIEQPNAAVDYDYYPNQRIQRVTRTDKTNITNSFGSTLGQQRVWLFEYTYHEVPGVTEGTLVSSVSIDGPLPGTSDVTTTKYDSDGQRTEFINALSHTTYYRDHNGRGQPQTIENSNGVITQLSYHPRGWLTHVTVKSPDGDPTKDSATQYDYYANGLLKQVISPDGSSIFYEYNEARHVIEIRNNMGESQILTPNEEGKWEAIETKNASLALTRQQNRVFDELGRVMDLFGQNNQHQHVDYNVNDQIDTVTDYGVDRTLTSSHQYDFLNRLSQVIRPTTLLIDGQPELVSVETVMDYDAHDNLASVVDPEGNETQYISNGFNERVTQISPDTGTTENWYDAAGNLEHSQDARGTQKDYIYDSLNRLTQIKYPASTLEDVNYFYDEVSASNPYAKGLLTRITDPTGSTSFVYDHRANISAVTRVIGGQTYSIAYQYNLANNLIAITYPSGRIVNYHRADDLGRISAVSMLAPGSSVPKILVTDIQYAPFGPITQFTYGNGLQRSVPLDLDYRIESISVAEGPLEKLNVSYTYDLFNNIKTITNLKDSDRSQSFIYDDLQRIQDAFGAYGNGTDHIHYEYDLVGNRLLRSLSQSSAVFSSEAYTYFPDSNQLESVTEARGEAVNVRQFTYDAAGLPQTEITLGNKSRVLNFGDNQRFNELTEEGETLATYQHDGFGQRAYKKAAVETHFYFGLNGELLGESLGENSVRREYVYLAGQPIAQFKRDVSDLQLTAEFTRDGATVDYVLSVLNVGPDPALNITLQNQLPDDVVINSIMPSAGSCQETVLLISCELGDLTANQDITISVQFTASASVDADALATASVSSDTPDQNMANNSVEFTPDDVCFIATAAFGSMQHSYLHILRDFRDNYLLPTGPGQWFVKQYYDYSPPIARWISGNEIAKTVTRVLLLPMILLAWFIQSSVMTKALVTMLIIAVYTGAKRFLLVNKVWHQRKKWLAVLVAAIAMISSATQAEELYYIHTNHLGAPSVLTDEEQNVVWEGDYRPFGEVVDIISNVDQPIRFPGQYEDTESNYYYNYFRDYDPGLGRYLQSDPIGLGGGVNTYAYVGGSPVNYVDPLGLCPAGGAICLGVPIAVSALGQALIDVTAGGIALCGLGIICNAEDSDNSSDDSCAAGDLPDMGGLSEDEAEDLLENAGFKKKDRKTNGGYQEWKHPDGSLINIRPNGEISRAGPKRPQSGNPHNSPWIRPRYDQNGNIIPHQPGGTTHGTGETVIK